MSYKIAFNELHFVRIEQFASAFLNTRVLLNVLVHCDDVLNGKHYAIVFC